MEGKGGGGGKAASVYKLFDKCSITLDDDGTLTIEWDNGAAMKAVTGATVDYIPPEWKWVVVKVGTDKFQYDFEGQYVRLADAKVEPRLAFVACLLRKTMASYEGAMYNVAELHVLSTKTQPIKVAPAVVQMMQKYGPTINNLVQQAFTIAAANGIMMLSTGHHYSSEDTIWGRFNQATLFGDIMATCGISNWEGHVFHDLMHPLDIDWLAVQVAQPKLEFTQKLNGVVTKRMPAMPAGSVKLGVIKGFLDYIRIAHPKLYEAFAAIDPVLEDLIARVRKDPLNWCSQFKRENTLDNLQRVDAFVPVGCILYGAIEALAGAGKKPTILKSRAFMNSIKNHPEYHLMGRKFVDLVPAEEFDPASIEKAVKAAIDRATANL